MSSFLRSLGFTSNPFSSYVAETEPDIEQYFVKPPYYSQILERGKSAQSFILFGARGSGKSASRIAFYKACWIRKKEGRSRPLAIVLDDYQRILGSGLEKVGVGSFVEEVAFLVIEGLLVWLSALDPSERDLYVNGLTPNEQELVVEVLKRFYINRPQLARSTSAKQALRLLNQAWPTEIKLWADKKWDALADLIAHLSSGLVNRASQTDADLLPGLRELLKLNKAEFSNSEYARALLTRLVEIARIFGFSGVAVLVDKVDETPETNGSAASSARLLYPLMSTTQLLEVDGFGWLVYLWDQVKELYGPNEQGVRIDKIANATIQWPEKFLMELVDKRLAFYSQQAITSFAQLCSEGLSQRATLEELIRMSMNSPRELIRILDITIREHEESRADGPLIQSSVDNALDKYVIERLPSLYPKQVLQQVSRINQIQFTNSDLQTVFKSGAQMVRNRIKKWQDCGIVGQIGSRPAQGGQQGRDAILYAVIDSRIHRLISRSLVLGPEYEVGENEDDSEPTE
jgi:hypothetical protein